MQVVFDKSVAPSILEAGYSYNPVSNSNTIEVYFDNSDDTDEALTGAGLSHLQDEVIYTMYNDCLLYTSDAADE